MLLRGSDTASDHEDTLLSTRACCALALLIALAGAGLRLAVPVTPSDAAYRAVVEAYPSKPRP